MGVPKTFVLCPDDVPPSGGIRKLYRLVDVLNANGFPAVIVHQAAGFRCRWFENKTPVVSFAEAKLAPSDLLVAAEILGKDLAEIGKGVRTIIVNQNAYYTFRHYSLDPNDLQTPYTDRRVVMTLAVSDDNREYLTYAFPGLKVRRFRYGIDPALFRPGETKRRQICFMPRKHADEALQVFNFLKFRGRLGGWTIVALDGKSEAETAAILRQSLIFLSFGYPEGLPLPPLEAMACGCLLIGYHGMGGREYFTEETHFRWRRGMWWRLPRRSSG
jgi:hypothetical protein